MDPRLPFLVALNGRITPSLNSFILSSRLREVMLATHGPSAASRLGVWSIRRPCSETPPLLRLRLLIASAPGWGSRSRRMPCEPLDAPNDLRKQALSQPAFGQLQDDGRRSALDLETQKRKVKRGKEERTPGSARRRGPQDRLSPLKASAHGPFGAPAGLLTLATGSAIFVPAGGARGKG